MNIVQMETICRVLNVIGWISLIATVILLLLYIITIVDEKMFIRKRQKELLEREFDKEWTATQKQIEDNQIDFTDCADTECINCEQKFICPFALEEERNS